MMAQLAFWTGVRGSVKEHAFLHPEGVCLCGEWYIPFTFSTRRAGRSKQCEAALAQRFPDGEVVSR